MERSELRSTEVTCNVKPKEPAKRSTIMVRRSSLVLLPLPLPPLLQLPPSRKEAFILISEEVWLCFNGEIQVDLITFYTFQIRRVVSFLTPFQVTAAQLRNEKVADITALSPRSTTAISLSARDQTESIIEPVVFLHPHGRVHRTGICLELTHAPQKACSMKGIK